MSRIPQTNYTELYKLFEEFKEANPKKGTIRAFCKKVRLKYASVQKAFKRLESKEVSKTDIKKLDKSLSDIEKRTNRTKQTNDEEEVEELDINPRGKNIYERRIQPALLRVEMMYFDGALDSDVYSYFKISHTTFYKYIDDYPELRVAIETGRMYSDFEIEKTMYKAATGQVVTEETRSSITNKGEPQITKIVKEHPPDTGVGRWWLGRRKGEKWPEKVDPHNLNPGNSLATVSDEELEEAIRKLRED